MEVVNLSGAGLVYEEAPALAEQLGKFPALKHLDVSANPGLRCPGASLILSAVSGKTRPLFLKKHVLKPPLFFTTLSCLPRSGRVC